MYPATRDKSSRPYKKPTSILFLFNSQLITPNSKTLFNQHHPLAVAEGACLYLINIRAAGKSR